MPASRPASSTPHTTSEPTARSTSGTTSGTRWRHGNAADVHYLEEARDALGPIMAASRAVATSGRSHHVRALARLALAEQADQLAAITAALSAWGRLDALSASPPPVDPVLEPRGTDQDRIFA